jgi:hypothetical protein
MGAINIYGILSTKHGLETAKLSNIWGREKLGENENVNHGGVCMINYHIFHHSKSKTFFNKHILL